MDKRIPNRSTDKDSAEGPRAGEAVSQPRRRAPAKDKPEAKPKPGFDKRTIALVYDFDGTLSPKPMQEYGFLPKIDVDPEAFWAESNRLAKQHAADRLITYMHLLYKKAKAAHVRIDRERPRRAGRSVELYPGVEAWFDAIGDYVKHPRRRATASCCATT